MSRLLNTRRSGMAVYTAAVLALTSIGIAHASTAEEVKAKIGDLKTALKAFDRKGSVSNDVKELRELLLDPTLVAGGPTDILIQYSGEIQALLKDNEPRQLVRANPTATESVKSLYAALDQIIPDTLVTARFSDLLTKLTGLMTASRSNQVALYDALQSRDVQDTRTAFEKAWTAIAQPRIHIIRSWFGDLRTKWPEGRLCAATSTMMTKCEAQSECRLDPATAAQTAAQPGSTYDQQILCGFDPAPLVDPANKGVAIEFACIRGLRPTWDEIAERPGINPKTGSPWDDEDIHQAVLRSSGMSIRCPFPVEMSR